MGGMLGFQGVSYTYPGGMREASRKLDLEVTAGSTTAILGPNGAGKTTLLHLALGWLQPSSGNVVFEGRPIDEWGRRELGRAMALVPQREQMAFEHTVLDTVLLGRTPHLDPLAMPGETDLAVAMESLERCGLSAFASRPVPCLSGGEQQLTLLARALTQEPRLLLLDEPFSHLDLGNRSRLVGVIRSLTAQGVTVLLTTHEPEIAAVIASHLILMREGQVQKSGLRTEILTGPALSDIYGIPVEVRPLGDRQIVLWD